MPLIRLIFFISRNVGRHTGIIFLLLLLAIISQGFAPRPPGCRHKKLLPLVLPPPTTTTTMSTARMMMVMSSTHTRQAVRIRKAKSLHSTTAKQKDLSIKDDDNDNDDNSISSSSSNNNVDIPILYETDRLLVINKPAGIPHHTTTTTTSTTAGRLGILALLRQQQQQQQLDQDDDNNTNNTTFPYNKGRIYGVHRLDAVTSGILVLAKDAAAASELTAAFRHSSSSRNRDCGHGAAAAAAVKKYYTGISRHKASNKKQGWIAGNMVRGRRKSWLLTHRADQTTMQQQPQSSKIFAKTRFFTAGLGDLQQSHYCHHHATTTTTRAPPKTLLLFRPYTGRTHQLRVAAKSVGLPLAGDVIYRDKFVSSSQQQQQQQAAAAAVDRTYLHATGLFIPPSKDPASALADGLAIWCEPPFAETLWDEEGQAKFRDIFYRLVRKHCDCPELLSLLPIFPDSTTTTTTTTTGVP